MWVRQVFLENLKGQKPLRRFWLEFCYAAQVGTKVFGSCWLGVTKQAGASWVSHVAAASPVVSGTLRPPAPGPPTHPTTLPPNYHPGSCSVLSKVKDDGPFYV